jgi:acetyl-CoA carboxylase biotin carboxyl carrier protein
MKIDYDAIKILAKLLREVDLTEIEYQIDSMRIKVSRQTLQTSTPVVAQTSTPHMEPSMPVLSSQELSQEALENHPGVIEAQMVGTVYLSPGSEAVPFVSLGDVVSQGQTLFIIEAMKVMNMIKAPRSGIVKHIFVKDSQPVEYGDPIIIIE